MGGATLAAPKGHIRLAMGVRLCTRTSVYVCVRAWLCVVCVVCVGVCARGAWDRGANSPQGGPLPGGARRQIARLPPGPGVVGTTGVVPLHGGNTPS